MRYKEIKYLTGPLILFLVFLVGDFHGTSWSARLTPEGHYVFETLAWVSGAWSFMALIRYFVWQRRHKQLGGASPPLLLQHTINLVIVALTSAAITRYVFQESLIGFWATSGVVGIILGVALRGIIADFFSGIALELSPPFKIGDWVELRMAGDLVGGRVTEVNWRATLIEPRDSTNTFYVPNSMMSSLVVNNLYRPLGRSRFELFLSFDPEVSYDRVLRVLMSAVLSTEGVAPDLQPEVMAFRYNASGIEYVVRYWVAPEVPPGGVRSKLIATIMDLSRRADLHISFPHEEVVFAAKSSEVQDPFDIKAAFLERNSFFRSWLPEELKATAIHMHARQYAPGTRIVTCGEPGNSMFLVSEGLLEVSLPEGKGNHALVVGRLLAGDYFGEMSMLTEEPRSATVTAITETVLYKIGRQHIRDLVQNRPEIVESMSHVAAERRLKNQNAELTLDCDAHEEEHRNLKLLILRKFHALFR